MLSCEVISDLMVVYASGEASKETRRLVEEHLARCTACREAFWKEALVEEATTRPLSDRMRGSSRQPSRLWPRSGSPMATVASQHSCDGRIGLSTTSACNV